MFTKALIVKTPEEGDNHYKVRIPLFEDTTGNEVIYDALSCHPPGVFNGYNEGDCVYVSFEDAKLNIPVIMGRLYTEEQDDYAKGLFNNLNVTNSANLPMSTTFGGKMSINNLYDALQFINSSDDKKEEIIPLDWGNIQGTLSNQTDLWNALTARVTTQVYNAAINAINANIASINTDLATKVNNDDLFKKVYPVGSIYISINAANPGTIFTGTTWEAYGQGRVLVGVGTGNDGTNTQTFVSGETGGEYKHQLTKGEQPKLSGTLEMHDMARGTNVYGRTGVFSTSTSIQNKYKIPTEAHTGASSVQTIRFENDGNDEAHNNIQPYIAVYMWRRTA